MAFVTLIFGMNHQNTDDRDVLERMLSNFLEGASVNDYNTHDRFWADDLIYTSAAGERMGKDDILRSLPAEPNDSENSPVYTARDVQINLYGDSAVVAFMLIAEISFDTGETETIRFYNTGTFLKREGVWQAVAWQATQIP